MCQHPSGEARVGRAAPKACFGQAELAGWGSSMQQQSVRLASHLTLCPPPQAAAQDMPQPAARGEVLPEAVGLSTRSAEGHPAGSEEVKTF